jgi:hypothetical protein
MARERLVYVLFVATAAAQLGALVLVGETRFNKGGIVLMVILATWLGRRSRVAWWLFVAGNAWLLLGTGSLLLPGGHVIWGNAITITPGSAGQLAILLSRPMRTWIRPPADHAGYAVTA